MKKFHLNSVLGIVGGFLLLVTVFVGGMYVGSNEATNQTPSSTTAQIQQTNTYQASQKDTILYTNKTWNFSIRYPAYLNEVQENATSVIFDIKDDPGLSGNAILLERTSLNSTEEWLNTQPKGSATSKGYELVLWLKLKDSGARTAILTKYVEYERDENNQPIYRKGLYAVHVENGVIYQFPLGLSAQLNATDDARVTSDMLNFLLSFKPYVE